MRNKNIETKLKTIIKYKNEIEELSKSLNGCEIECNGKSGMIDCVDGNRLTLNIYLEDEFCNVEDRFVSFDEFIALMNE